MSDYFNSQAENLCQRVSDVQTCGSIHRTSLSHGPQGPCVVLTTPSKTTMTCLFNDISFTCTVQCTLAREGLTYN